MENHHHHEHDHQSDNEQPSLSIPKPKLYRLMNNRGGGAPKSPPSIWFEIRLFYVRIAPCAIDDVPDHLTLRHLRDELGVSLEINGNRVPASETASSNLRRDRVDRDSSEVTYVSTDNIKISGGVEFEVYEKENLILCGSLGRFENEWSMDFYSGGSSPKSSSAFFQPKLGISSPSIEVYVAGRWSDTPVILTKMINVSPRRKSPRYSTLDSIPEVSDEVEKDHNKLLLDANASLRQRKLQITGTEDEYEADGKLMHNWYPEEVYEGEDGQLTWFNAGVRVGVGIGLGMCLGIGIGVGLLMRSYQTTTRNFRRKFF